MLGRKIKTKCLFAEYKEIDKKTVLHKAKSIQPGKILIQLVDVKKKKRKEGRHTNWRLLLTVQTLSEHITMLFIFFPLTSCSQMNQHIIQRHQAPQPQL